MAASVLLVFKEMTQCKNDTFKVGFESIVSHSKKRSEEMDRLRIVLIVLSLKFQNNRKKL
jgi:hypothetical protein